MGRPTQLGQIPLVSPRPPAGRWIRRSFVALLVLSVASVAGGLHRWLEVVTHFQPWLAGGYACFLAGAAIPRVRAAFWRPGRVLILAGVGLLLHGLQVAWLWVPAEQPDLDAPQRFRLVVANVLWNRKERRDLLRFFEESEADVLALCELDGELYDTLGQWRERYPYQADNRLHGVAILSRLPLEEVAEHTFSPEQEGLAATIVAGRRRARMIVVHNETPGQVEYEQGLAHLARQCGEIDGALLLVGDLNSSNWSPWFRRILREGGMRDTRRGYGTLSSWWPLDFPILRFPIDHVLVKGPVRLGDLRRGPGVGSDHRPLIAEVELGGRRGRNAASD